MEEKKNSIFRKQALDRVSTPEELDRYLMVTRPGIWFVLIGIIVLLVGVFAWGIFGHLETRIPVVAVAAEDGTVCYVPDDSVENVLDGGKIVIANEAYPLYDAGFAKQIVSNDVEDTLCLVGGFVPGDVVVPIAVEGFCGTKGTYTGYVLVETVKPISFILN